MTRPVYLQIESGPLYRHARVAPPGPDTEPMSMAFQPGSWLAADVATLARTLTYVGPRAALEDAHNGGHVDQQAIHEATSQAASALLIALPCRSREEFLMNWAFQAPAYWLDPMVRRDVVADLPVAHPREMKLGQIWEFCHSLVKSCLQVTELDAERKKRTKFTFSAITDRRMRAINIAMTNYTYMRLLYARAGIDAPDLSPAGFTDHTARGWDGRQVA